MYTQCSHCRSTFRVNMKELTAAQGLLRCGECDTIFDAMKSLTTTLNENHSYTQQLQPNTASNDQTSAILATEKTSFWKHWFNRPKEQHYSLRAPKKKASWLLIISFLSLFALLAIQAIYTARHWLAQQPVIGHWIVATCQHVGCQINDRRNLEKIRMVSRNVFSHPNSPDVLIIKASVQNDATFPQRYPIVEISFLNKASEIVALRRFRPQEYLELTTDNALLMPIRQPKELSVNVKDPGTEAVRYHFRFL